MDCSPAAARGAAGQGGSPGRLGARVPVHRGQGGGAEEGGREVEAGPGHTRHAGVKYLDRYLELCRYRYLDIVMQAGSGVVTCYKK